jgi:hypothetical protein
LKNGTQDCRRRPRDEGVGHRVMIFLVLAVFSLTRRTILWDRTWLKCSTIERLERQKGWAKDTVINPHYGDESDEYHDEGKGGYGNTTLTPKIMSTTDMW